MKNKVIWVVVDGGSNIIDPKDTFGSCGFNIYVEGDSTLEKLHEGAEYHTNTTTPRMEFQAVKNALTYINENMKFKKCDIYVLVDAANTKLTFEQWMYSWMRKSVGGVWYRSSGEEVLNQDLIKSIVPLINDTKKDNYLKFLHIKSHITPKTFNDDFNKFLKTNKMVISREKFVLLSKLNSVVDTLCTKTMEEGRLIQCQSLNKHN